MKDSIHFIITAAGLSRRNPPNKLLLNFKNNSVIQSTVSVFLNSKSEISIITGYQQKEIEAHLHGFDLRIIHNPDYRTGLASSMKTGILSCEGDVEYYAFCNGDKPFINESTVRLLSKKCLEGKPKILVPCFNGKNGHPTYFHKSLRAELLAIEGDEGGRSLIRKYEKQTLFCDINDRGVILDMDLYLSETNA